MMTEADLWRVFDKECILGRYEEAILLLYVIERFQEIHPVEEV